VLSFVRKNKNKKRLTPTHSNSAKNDVTGLEATHLTSNDQFRQTFSSLMTLFLNCWQMVAEFDL